MKNSERVTVKRLVRILYFLICVVIQEGEFSFPLEDVKKLKDFLDSDATMKQNRVALGNPKAMCTQPGFPQELQPVCQSKDANASLLRLGKI